MANTSTSTVAAQNLHAKRLSTQPLLPQRIQEGPKQTDSYNIFPAHVLEPGSIHYGYQTLVNWMLPYDHIIIDGYGGVFWEEVRNALNAGLENHGYRVNWINIARFMKAPAAIQEMVDPFVGEPGAVWGTRAVLELADFFLPKEVAAIRPDAHFDLTVVYGTGASFVNWPDAPVIYIDLPKDEIQYRMRAGSITNLGAEKALPSTEMYKRFYFVDWVVLNNHKKNLLNRISVLADAQWTNHINWMTGDTMREALQQLTTTVFRVRPWFAAGAWGGQWMKERLGLTKEEVNYAWSFELIVPENGIIFESDGNLLELSFDFLMFADNKAVLGKHADVFGDAFPIRFDFLDTWEGGNLSIQCHPSLQYIRDNFGEAITQDETYYILDCKDDAKVYLGFQENIQPAVFKEVLEESLQNNVEVPVEAYVQAHTAHKHDLFLIPNGTVHSAGANNLVLEISATPYIFTFKMYDWLRLDLNGQPRPINIEHAFKNLKFERKGKRVQEELISKQRIIETGNDWQLVHLPTHAEHFYDVQRAEFDSRITLPTNESCQVLMLVEGSSVSVEMPGGNSATFQYAETFVIPAAAGSYTLINNGNGRAKVVRAFLKDNIDSFIKQLPA